MKATLILEDGTTIGGTLGHCEVKRDEVKTWSDGRWGSGPRSISGGGVTHIQITLEVPIEFFVPSILERKEDPAPTLHG